MTSLLSHPDHTAGRVVSMLRAEAMQHRAVRHPFLARFAGAGFANQPRVARQLISDYAGFAAWGLRYPAELLQRVTGPGHRLALLRQLAVAHGQFDERDEAALTHAGIATALLRSVSRPELYRRLCAALEVEPWKLQHPQPAAQRWRAALLQLLREASLAEAIGALCFGLVGTAGAVGDQLAIGLQQLGVLHRVEAVYFELPSLLGARDLDEVNALAVDHAGSPEALAAMRRGMKVALDLAADFWDQQYAGAVSRRLAYPA